MSVNIFKHIIIWFYICHVNQESLLKNLFKVVLYIHCRRRVETAIFFKRWGMTNTGQCYLLKVKNK